MATRIAEYVTQKLLESSVIEEGDRELFVYGFFLLVMRSFFLFITVFAGLMVSIPGESILFYMVFMFLRTYAGGVHARTEMTCTILTSLTLIISVFGIKFMEQMNNDIIPVLMFIGGCVSILLFSPLDTKEKPLEDQEKKKYRTVCVSAILLCTTVAFVAYLFALEVILCPLAGGVCLEGVLLIIGKICHASESNTSKV